MPGKGSKPKAQNTGGKKKSGKRAAGSKKKKKKEKASQVEVDIMSPAAMFNLYYISHNVPTCLAYRGFLWPGRPKKKGRK
ncbi:small lysine-rich protein 1 [Leucoraja erinacea]|uniref:small lysine-rich protein 1 n=1 Tax=Leucoraja erinaceus TaxID=7782 RepID=UPI0024574A45|nr:small lysine-rich protein 1 [Leucoraja erinacea]XP_055509315.1 small lysine-rich protein 1 [Leucoraja erinacea]